MEDAEILDRFNKRMDDTLTDYEKCIVLSELSLKSVDRICKICHVTDFKRSGRGSKASYNKGMFANAWNSCTDYNVLAKEFNVSYAVAVDRILYLRKRGYQLKPHPHSRKK